MAETKLICYKRDVTSVLRGNVVILSKNKWCQRLSWGRGCLFQMSRTGVPLNFKYRARGGRLFQISRTKGGIRYVLAAALSPCMNLFPENRRQLEDAKLQLKKSKRKDYYKILGVTSGAADDELKKAYKKEALKHHPGERDSTMQPTQ